MTDWWMTGGAVRPGVAERDPPGVVNVRVAELRNPKRCGGKARAYHDLAASPDHVYCGRRVHHVPATFNSPFRNDVPGAMRMTQEGAVGAFEQRYREKLAKNPELVRATAGLLDKTLGCWCKPKPCHCDVLLKIAEDCAQMVVIADEAEDAELKEEAADT